MALIVLMVSVILFETSKKAHEDFHVRKCERKCVGITQICL